MNFGQSDAEWRWLAKTEFLVRIVVSGIKNSASDFNAESRCKRIKANLIILGCIFLLMLPGYTFWKNISYTLMSVFHNYSLAFITYAENRFMSGYTPYLAIAFSALIFGLIRDSSKRMWPMASVTPKTLNSTRTAWSHLAQMSGAFLLALLMIFVISTIFPIVFIILRSLYWLSVSQLDISHFRFTIERLTDQSNVLLSSSLVLQPLLWGCVLSWIALWCTRPLVICVFAALLIDTACYFQTGDFLILNGSDPYSFVAAVCIVLLLRSVILLALAIRQKNITKIQGVVFVLLHFLLALFLWYPGPLTANNTFYTFFPALTFSVLLLSPIIALPLQVARNREKTEENYAHWNHLLKPRVIAALVLLLAAATVVRIAEYQLPVIADNLYKDVERKYNALDHQERPATLPDEENAMILYDQALKAMVHLQQEQGSNIPFSILKWRVRQYDREDDYEERTNTYVIPIPSQPFPESIHKKMQEYLKVYQPTLNLLHRASEMALPWELWEYTIEIPHDAIDKYKKGRMALSQLLLLDALVNILDKNEEHAIRSLKSFKAFSDAQRQYIPYPLKQFNPIYEYHERLWELYCYGVEQGVFLTPSLELFRDMYYLRAKPLYEIVVQEALSLQKANEINTKKNAIETQPETNSCYDKFCFGIYWYNSRMQTLSSTNDMIRHISSHNMVLRDLPSCIDWQNYRTEYWMIKDPYARFSPIDFTYYLVNLLEHHRMVSRLSNELPCLPIAVAIEKYYRENGEYPEELSRLAPSFLSSSDLEYYTQQYIIYLSTETGWALGTPSLGGLAQGSLFFPLGSTTRGWPQELNLLTPFSDSSVVR